MNQDTQKFASVIAERLATELVKISLDVVAELKHDRATFIAENQLMVTAELANMLGVPESWVLEKARIGEIPSLKLGTYRRFHPPTIEQWLRDNHENGALGSVRRSAS